MQSPTTKDEITGGWLTGALRQSGAIYSAKVEAFKVTKLTGGMIGDVNRVELHYDVDELNAPSSVIAKFAHTDPELRSALERNGIYEREVGVYRELVPEERLNLPFVHVAERDADSGLFVLLLEDLGRLRVVSSPERLDFSDAKSVMDYLARMHSGWWQRPKFFERTWIPEFGEPDASTRAQERFNSIVEPFLAVAGKHLSPGVEEIALRLAPRLAQIRRRLSEPPLTLNH